MVETSVCLKLSGPSPPIPGIDIKLVSVHWMLLELTIDSSSSSVVGEKFLTCKYCRVFDSREPLHTQVKIGVIYIYIHRL